LPAVHKTALLAEKLKFTFKNVFLLGSGVMEQSSAEWGTRSAE